MAKKTTKTTRKKAEPKAPKAPKRTFFWWIGVGPVILVRWALRAVMLVVVLLLLAVGAYTFINPPTTAYILMESLRHDGVRREWRDFEQISPEMPRAIVAAEDANFCAHWGFDMAAIRDALEDGTGRGASTISQQTVKNVFLWQGRNWVRKAMEAMLTPLVETIWTKQRILEVYMNVAEFDKGVFGVAAASEWYFGVDAKDLTATQAARLAVVLPNPKARSAKNPTKFLRGRASSVIDGAATIRADGRSACFEG